MDSEKQHGGIISNDEFNAMREAYEKKNPDQTKSVLFSSDVIRKALNKENVRVYFGLDAEGRQTVIFKAEGSGGATQAIASDDPPVNKGQLCPPVCS